MDVNNTNKWNNLFANEEYVYGQDANEYLKEQLVKLNLGSILFPAEGEGRNAVFAAKIGWKVTAFDISANAQTKALMLANKNKVSLDYMLGELESLDFQSEKFDAIALIFAHFPASQKSFYHKLLDKYLRKNGFLIFEAFSKKHLDFQKENPNVGGPRDIESLFSIDEIKSDFPNYNYIELKEEEIELHEGLLHNGKGSVIRFLAQKK